MPRLGKEFLEGATFFLFIIMLRIEVFIIHMLMPSSFPLQWSLSRLMTTLNQANPYFIRCIKSNSEKVSLVVTCLIVR